ncbi:MAG: 1-phosphofructokinase [Lachnospiraceae bacterium]|nr:1-phosphofructokinase [Lachnospiraceae bacterium]
MILTVTLNPAVDKTYTSGELITGHVNRMRTVMSIAGGKGINVTKVLRQYDYPVCATGFLGGYAGDFIEDYLKGEAVDCRFVRVEDETRSNMNILADNGYVTEILEPGPEISDEKLQQFLTQYKTLLSECELVVLSGSVARGLPDDIYAQLIKEAKSKGIRTILDTSGEPLKKGIDEKPYMIKPNQKELEYIVGHKLVKRDAVMDAALFIHKKGIEHVVVSMGKKGLLSVSGGKVFFTKAAKVTAINTVACGDSVVASYAMSILKNEGDEQALIDAAAISAANATTLVSADIPKDTAKELEEHINIEKLK